MPPVKRSPATFTERLELLLKFLSPWREKSLTYGELAEKMGPDWTEEAVKSWAKREEFAAAARERLVELALEEGLEGVTGAWLRDGTGVQPHKGVALPPRKPQDEGSGLRGASVGAHDRGCCIAALGAGG